MPRRRRLRSYVRARLRRRLFAWFSLTIAATTMVVAVALGAVSRREASLGGGDDELRAFAGELFARDWGDAETRARFADRTAAAFGAGVELRAPDERVLHRAGPTCARGARVLPVLRGDELLGRVHLCVEHPRRGWGWLLGLAGALGVVAVASGLVARRIARPLDELADVVRRLGNGELSARAKLGCRAPDEIGAVAGAVNDMAARLETQVQEQRELLATVSHELRTPLARLRLLTELVRDGASAKRLDAIDEELAELDALVGGLLAHSRAELGLLHAERAAVRELASRALERAGLDDGLMKVTGSGDDEVVVDRGLLTRALANLLENARHHGGGADELTVTLDEEVVRFEVTDRGEGLADGLEPFDKFARGSEEHDTGLGLGLSLVRAAAEAHGGRAWLRAREGGGVAAGFEVRRAVPIE